MCSFDALTTRSQHTTTWLQVLLGVRFIPPSFGCTWTVFLELVAPACFPWKCAWMVLHSLRLPPSPFFLHCGSIPTYCTDLDAWCETGNILLSLSLSFFLFSSLSFPPPRLCAFALVSRHSYQLVPVYPVWIRASFSCAGKVLFLPPPGGCVCVCVCVCVYPSSTRHG